MKLISVIHAPEFGGPQNQALRLAPILGEHGVESVTVIPDGPATIRLRDAGLRVETIPLGRVRAVRDWRVQLGTVRRLPFDLAALVQLYRRERADVVQLNGLMNPHAAIAARIAGVPVVWQILDTRTPVMLRKVMRPFIGSLASVVMPVGREVARVHPGVESKGDRMVVFYPPVDTVRFAPDQPSTLRQELGIPDGAPIVGVVGNVNPQKGHEYFVEAAAKVRRRLPQAHFVIAGQIKDNHGAYYRRLLDLAESGGLVVGRDIFFLDARRDIPNVLAALDVFALASVPDAEGTPTAILEAMACGLPVVASRVASIPEVVEDGRNGYLTPSRDADALANRLTELLQDAQLRRRMGEAGRLRAVAEFGLDRCVDAHIRAYHLAAGRPVPPSIRRLGEDE